MQEKTNELKASPVDIPKNPAESYRKTLFNYDLEINNAINLSELYASADIGFSSLQNWGEYPSGADDPRGCASGRVSLFLYL